MTNKKVLIKFMSESDIVYVNIIEPLAEAANGSPFLIGLDQPDEINLLAHWLVLDRGPVLAKGTASPDAMTKIAGNIVADSSFTAQIGAGANFFIEYPAGKMASGIKGKI